MTQRVRDHYDEPGANVAYGLVALVCGLALCSVRWLARHL